LVNKGVAVQCNITEAQEVTNSLASVTIFNGIHSDFGASSNSNEVQAYIHPHF
jgi:hypothetical protein